MHDIIVVGGGPAGLTAAIYALRAGKTVLVIAVGCTGGHHRSVAVAHEISEFILKEGYPVTENHRDISR